MLFADNGEVYTTADLKRIYLKKKKAKDWPKGKEYVYESFNTFLFYSLYTDKGDLFQTKVKGE